MKNKIPLEDDEAYILADWLRLKKYKFTHITNETNIKSPWVRNKQKKMGKSPGVPDYMIILPGVGLLFIELKRIKGGTLSEEQASWIEALNTLPGIEATCCKGAKAAIEYIEDLTQNHSAVRRSSNE